MGKYQCDFLALAFFIFALSLQPPVSVFSDSSKQAWKRKFR